MNRLFKLLGLYEGQREIERIEAFNRFGLYRLDFLRQAVINPTLDETVVALQDRIVGAARQVARELNLDAIVYNNGSTHPDRLTCVQDPTGYKPFPPDVDVNFVVNGLIPPDTKRRICDVLGIDPPAKTDEAFGQEVLVWREDGMRHFLWH